MCSSRRIRAARECAAEHGVRTHRENPVRAIPLVVALGLTACATSAPSPQLMLGKGAYRIEGQCTSMRSLSRDETSQCESHMGIITADPSKPSFLFSRRDKGTWLFKVSEPASYSNGGNTASYRVSSVLDSSDNRAHDLPGECTLTVEGPPVVTCSVSLKSGTKIKEASFKGGGTWQFSEGTE